VSVSNFWERYNRTQPPHIISGGKKVQLSPTSLGGLWGHGRRHLRGYRVLADKEPGRLEVTAVIDPEIERAEFVAGESEALLGTRPQVYRSLEDALIDSPELDMLDLVATAAVHPAVAQVAAEAGLHVLCEKPMAPTVAACRAMQAGAIGDIRTVLDFSAGGGRKACAGGWRTSATKAVRFWSRASTTLICRYTWLAPSNG
jgi:hypothetical protein